MAKAVAAELNRKAQKFLANAYLRISFEENLNRLSLRKNYFIITVGPYRRVVTLHYVSNGRRVYCNNTHIVPYSPLFE